MDIMHETYKMQDRYQFPPGMKAYFRYDEMFHEWNVSFFLMTQDSYHPPMPTEIVSSIRFKATEYQEIIDTRVYMGAMSLWKHEFDEWFKVDGKLAHDPHNRGELDLGLLTPTK